MTLISPDILHSNPTEVPKRFMLPGVALEHTQHIAGDLLTASDLDGYAADLARIYPGGSLEVGAVVQSGIHHEQDPIVTFDSLVQLERNLAAAIK